MNINPSISHRTIKNRHRDGTRVEYLRYIVEFRDPRSGHRKARKFKRRLDAVAFRNELIIQVKEGSYVDSREAPTVAEAVDHYLADRANHVKANTLQSYRLIMKRITDPLLIGTPQQRADHSLSGAKPSKAKFIPTLGKVRISDLTTAQIRQWHNKIAEHCGDYTARRAASHLKMVLALAEEDFDVRAPTMPANLARRKPRVKKTILKPEDIGFLLEAARLDKQRGIYYAFPFLAGTRPSEQLGLLWSDVDLHNNIIHIRRVQERNGALTDMTKTEAGTREIPIAPTLLTMLQEWQAICPRDQGELHRVFPGPGRLQPWPLPRIGGGGPLLYQNWLRRYWKPAIEKLGLPYVEPHSARHCFISTLQAQGIEVGLVAQFLLACIKLRAPFHVANLIKFGGGNVKAQTYPLMLFGVVAPHECALPVGTEANYPIFYGAIVFPFLETVTLLTVRHVRCLQFEWVIKVL